MADPALLIIDIQNDYFPGGKMELEGADAAAANAARALGEFRRKAMPIVHVRHLSVRPGATFFIPGTAGADIHERVRPTGDERVIEKNYPNSFRATDLDKVLKDAGVTQLVVAGMMTHMCVDATTRAAFDYGFECWVASDACATRALTFQGQTIPAQQVHGSFLAALASMYGKVMNVEEIITSV